MIRSLTCLGSALAVLALTGGCALSSKPGVFTAQQSKMTVTKAPLDVTLIKPAAADRPRFLVVFASGDGGLHGVSKAILEHLAGRGYWIAGFSSPDAFERAVQSTGEHPNYLATRDAFQSIVKQAKQTLGLPADLPLIVTGMSRGANVVIAAAADPAVNPAIAGAVAIALTREFDDLTIPESAKQQLGVEVDDQGRLQTYPAIKRLGSIPLAIIQSTKDDYVESAESRRMLGPDTPTRRLYEVPSDGHSFGGGEDALMRDLDDAMGWIASLKLRVSSGG